MLRECDIQRLPWADKTMSVLRTKQLEACEKRLDALPSRGLFTGCDDARVAELWRCSFEGQEHPMPLQLPTAHDLQGKVMLRLPAEAALLSGPEGQLVELMLMQGGEMALTDMDSFDAAEALVRRLWCTLTTRDEVRVLRLERALCGPLACILAAQEHEELRERLAAFSFELQSALYIYGALPFEPALHELCAHVLAGTHAHDLPLAARFLRTSFDYICRPDGSLLLIHPAAADPAAIRAVPSTWREACGNERLRITEEGILPEERPLYELMYGQLQQAVRPECPEDEAVNDLVMLCKQGVSFEDLAAVLSSMLIVRPTDRMLGALRTLSEQIPRWNTLRAGRVQ